MSFTSIAFFVFLPLVFAGYWLLGRLRGVWPQNLFVVAASYVFYGWWDWRFLALISFTAIFSWASGVVMGMEVRDNIKKWIVVAAIIVNIGILGVFKYYNFFVSSITNFMNALGLKAHLMSLNIILPVGISFYTFQALSYVMDVQRGNIRPTKDLVAFLAYVSFFPQLVAGPVERATSLLPQFLGSRQFDYSLAVDGCRQMLWGFCKKVLVADTCAEAANAILNNFSASSVSLWLGVTLFAFQIYGDFSGYSDIAIGCSKLFGIHLMRNFTTPYFSRDIAEFWRRWHISLTTWFRDYLYIPLGGSRCGTWKKIRNTYAIFLVSGLWHGANWTFIAWGMFHATCFLPLLLCGKNRRYTSSFVAKGKILPSLREVWQMAVTFLLVVLGWAFFRAPNIATAGSWLKKMVLFSDLSLRGTNLSVAKVALVSVVFLLLVEWFNRGLDVPRLPRWRILRWTLYYGLIAQLVFFHAKAQTFIYFQF